MSKDELAEGVAVLILEQLKPPDRSVAWLSRTTGISYDTLNSQLKRNPASLPITHAILIAHALDLPLGALVPEAATR